MKRQSMSAVPCVRAIVLLVGLVAVVSLPMQAQTYSVIHNFTGSDGANPVNGLIAVGNGGGGGGNGPIISINKPPSGPVAFYGIASAGGASNDGAIFKMSTDGTVSLVHSFSGPDGSQPQGELIADGAGNLYGTTFYGGAHGIGAVFQLSGSTVTTIYSFSGSDGDYPQGGLVLDKAGNLYGTTTAGGTDNNGTVFRLSPPAKSGGAWTETVLYSFGPGSDGQDPVAGVSLDAAGNLYGTTSAGGANGFGTVFQLVAGGKWKENILHDFQNGLDGSVPFSGLIADSAGNFYGTATQGGSGGGGTIFELSPGKNGWNFTVLSSVPGWGISGPYRNLVMDASGTLYGGTHCDGDSNAGTIFSLKPSGGNWQYTLLYTFSGGTDGKYVISNLVTSQGKVYGTTYIGGKNGLGVIFEVTP